MCRLAQTTTTNSCWQHNQHIPIRYPRHHTRPLNIGWGLWLPTLNKYDAVSVVWTPDMGLKIPNGERTGLWWQLKVRERLSWVYNHTVRECINRRVYTFPTVAMLEHSIRNMRPEKSISGNRVLNSIWGFLSWTEDWKFWWTEQNIYK